MLFSVLGLQAAPSGIKFEEVHLCQPIMRHYLVKTIKKLCEKKTWKEYDVA